jgi:phosphatidylserine decarboxylase
MKRVEGLLALNESVTLMGEWKYGILSMTAVGALNVGGIYLKRATITNDEDEKTIDVSRETFDTDATLRENSGN